MAKPLNNVRNLNNNNGFKKANGFLNISIRTKTGEKKVGAIALHEDKELHALLLQNADNIEKMQFITDMHVVEQEDDLALDLSGDDTTEQLKQAIAAQ